MNKEWFVETYLPLARQAGERFGLNPVVILAQAAFESGWGQSNLAKKYNNFFGITGGGRANEFWSGMCVQLGKHSLYFRRYGEPLQSFMDYGRLITSAYQTAAAVSNYPEAFAHEIAYSRYICEQNGDDRKLYRKSIISIAKWIEGRYPINY